MILYLRIFLGLIIAFILAIIINKWATLYITSNLENAADEATFRTIDVIKKNMYMAKESEIPNLLIKTKQELGHPIEVITAAEFNISNIEGEFPDHVLSDLSSVGYAFLYTEYQESIVQVLLNDRKHIVQAGPIPYSSPVTDYQELITFLIFSTISGLMLYFCLRPLITRLQHMEHIAILIGEGKLDARIYDKQKDTIGFVAQSVDNMAGQIQSLLERNNQHVEEQRNLLHAVAHELRNPMARLRFALDMMYNNAETKTVDQKHELYTDVSNALDDLDHMVTEVLGYARMEHGESELKYETLNLPESINDTIKQINNIYSETEFGITPHEDIDPNIEVDIHQFKRALINIMRNAARFSVKDVNIDWGHQHDKFWVAVHDDGAGIPPNKRERIFEPFTRLDSSRSRDSGGSGLGLAIVATISKKHHGTITVDDSHLGGAVFLLTWPDTKPL